MLLDVSVTLNIVCDELPPRVVSLLLTYSIYGGIGSRGPPPMTLLENKANKIMD